MGSAMLGLDRAQMEAERLARLQQKKKCDEELLSGANNMSESNVSRKRKAFETLPRSKHERKMKAKYSTLDQPTEKDITTPNPTPSLPLTSGSRTKDPSPTHLSQLLTLREPISDTYVNQPSKAPTQRGSRTKDTSLTQDSQSLVLREPRSGTDASHSSKAAIQRTAPGFLSLHQQQALQVSGIQYPDGIVKRTWARGNPQEDDMIRIEEVFQKDDLGLAVLSTFQVDPDWVSTKLLEETKVIWVLGARDEAEVSRSLFRFFSVSSLTMSVRISSILSRKTVYSDHRPGGLLET